MRQFKKILDKNDLKVNKYTMKGKAMLVDTHLGQFVLKENKGNNNIYLLMNSYAKSFI